MRNQIYTPIKINEKVNRNISNKDNSYSRGFSVEDGICFTRFDIDGVFHDIDEIRKDKVDAICFVFTTYMKRNKMSSEQDEAIEKEELKAWDLYFRNKL